MKVAFTGVDLPEGKVKLPDAAFDALVEQFKPAKVSPYFFEFLPDAYEPAAAIVIAEDRILDLLVNDMEKIESRLSRVEDDAERAILERCQAHLEDEKPICDMTMTDEEAAIVRVLALWSHKGTILLPPGPVDLATLWPTVMEKAGVMFFYTAGKQEVHAWFVEQGSDAVTCAGKIHTDLSRGFIKAEIIDCQTLASCHSMQDARSKGLTQLVDRDYIIGPNMVLDIRFNV